MFSSVKGHFSYWTVFSFVVLVCLVCVICVFYRLISTQILRGFVVREQKRSRLQYELEFLKNQLSPHFLFNTLNNITALISIDSKRAEKSMMELSKLLRVTLYQTADDMIPLEEDVEILRMYGNLEKLRLDDSFDYRFDVELENPKVMIPPLVAMPLVENALKHSKNPKGKSFAHISIRQQGDELVLETENSNFPKVSQSPRKASGLGLSTFQKRLEILYAGRYEYTASAEGDVYRSRLKIQLADN
jgi:LytS/YehU family sensor histidine kinase